MIDRALLGVAVYLWLFPILEWKVETRCPAEDWRANERTNGEGRRRRRRWRRNVLNVSVGWGYDRVVERVCSLSTHSLTRRCALSALGSTFSGRVGGMDRKRERKQRLRNTTSEQTNKQISKQGSKQTNKHANKQANNQSTSQLNIRTHASPAFFFKHIVVGGGVG